jgi:hypothetical protein
LKDILEDILEKTGMMDSKLRLKWDIVFGGQKLVIRDGKAYLE